MMYGESQAEGGSDISEAMKPTMPPSTLPAIRIPLERFDLEVYPWMNGDAKVLR